jgi:hypothetical protein
MLVPTFFPEAEAIEFAQEIALQPGTRLEGQTIRMLSNRAFRVSGKVDLPEDGKLRLVLVRRLVFTASGAAPNPMDFWMESGVRLLKAADAAGVFTVERVPAGRYHLMATKDGAIFTAQEIEVHDRELSGVSIRGAASRVIEVKVENWNKLPEDSRPTRLTVQGIAQMSGMGGMRQLKVDLDAKGKGTIPQPEPGNYVVAVVKMGSIWFVERMKV